MISLALLAVAVCGTLGDHQYYKLGHHGDYHYGYNTHLGSKHESGDHSGHVSGSFSYVDGHGHHQSAHYKAGPHTGFQIHATNLPKAPVDHNHHTYAGGYDHHSHYYHGPPAPLKHDGTVDYTPEVKKARAEHFAALHGYPHHSYAGAYHHGYHGYAPLKHDGTVDDLPEVKAARAAHLAEYNKVLYSRYRRDLSDFHGHSHDYHHKYHGPPAPLNHDGTVAETPEVKHAKAAHLAAHHEAASKAHYESSYDDGHYDDGHYDDGHYNEHNDDDHHHDDHSHDYHHKYHGPPAPLNHDGTVAETPEVKHAKAVHFQLYNKFLHRHKRAIAFQPAPLNADGTVAETPEVQRAKEAFVAAYSAEAAHADHSWVEPKYNDEPKFSNYVEPVQYSFPTAFKGFSQPEYHSGFKAALPTQGTFASFDGGSHFAKPLAPAPLNSDGTVADTPEIQAAKAVHLAAHRDALSRVATKSRQNNPSHFF